LVANVAWLDLKATALLKLIYLEMVGHDMSWASFHVLEVMSSPKYHQKRVGYLGAVQSFRPDTEVLMLATNLLKKVRRWHTMLSGVYQANHDYAGPWHDDTDGYISPDSDPSPRHHTLISALDTPGLTTASKP
jgi:hypothetical protein